MDRGLEIIADYVSKLGRQQSGDAYYRGHIDRSWSVIPSAFRRNGYGITTENQLSRWRRASSRFANPRPQSDLEWLVLAQHYGVPTILLDWTTNPLIALFFAVEHNVKDKAGLVLRYTRKAFQVLKTPERVKPFLESRKKPALIDTSAMNARTLAQDSAMSIHCSGCERMSVVSENKFFEIASQDKYSVRSSLKQFGLTPERLYSDINVVAREFSNELLLDDIL